MVLINEKAKMAKWYKDGRWLKGRRGTPWSYYKYITNVCVGEVSVNSAGNYSLVWNIQGNIRIGPYPGQGYKPEQKYNPVIKRQSTQLIVLKDIVS